MVRATPGPDRVTCGDDPPHPATATITVVASERTRALTGHSDYDPPAALAGIRRAGGEAVRRRSHVQDAVRVVRGLPVHAGDGRRMSEATQQTPLSLFFCSSAA